MSDQTTAVILRAVGVVGLLGVALVHLLDVVGKMSETPYVGWMYIGLMVGAVLLAAVLVVEGSRRVWAAVAALTASVLIGFLLSRTTGLPNAKGDIGNWSEALGLASMFVEGCLLAVAGGALALLGGVRLHLPVSHRHAHSAGHA